MRRDGNEEAKIKTDRYVTIAEPNFSESVEGKRIKALPFIRSDVAVATLKLQIDGIVRLIDVDQH